MTPEEFRVAQKRVLTAETVMVLLLLNDLHQQATTERSHYYVAKCVRQTIELLRDLLAFMEDAK